MAAALRWRGDAEARDERSESDTGRVGARPSAERGDGDGGPGRSRGDEWLPADEDRLRGGDVSPGRRERPEVSDDRAGKDETFFPQPARGAALLRNFSLRRRLGLIEGLEPATLGRGPRAIYASSSSCVGHPASPPHMPSPPSSYPVPSPRSVRMSGSGDEARLASLSPASPVSTSSPFPAARCSVSAASSPSSAAASRRADLLAPFTTLRLTLAPAAMLRAQKASLPQADSPRASRPPHGPAEAETESAREGREESTERDDEPSSAADCGLSATPPHLKTPALVVPNCVGGGDLKAADEDRDGRRDPRREEELAEKEMQLEEQREARALTEAALKLAKEKIRALERDNAALRAGGGLRALLALSGARGQRRANWARRQETADSPLLHDRVACSSLRERGRSEEAEAGAAGREGADERGEGEREASSNYMTDRGGGSQLETDTDVLEQKLRLYRRQLLSLSQENQRLWDFYVQATKREETSKAEESKRKEKSPSISDVADARTYVVSRPQFDLRS
ncbi:hypothetical protein BESB_069210 [Besnoitia besnoiti]|uniref:Uncharacterized protein n=1 Tax=Besnoitia besnoiti TaxID=94643 RepID=A0A2A9M8S9_BESBE|nr:hypothetical protein BESB_069210 [Besnoitia besnoiti]PFH34888.1 hypothetical protein BESB_069210 [Besnoitia besnoiti]